MTAGSLTGVVGLARRHRARRNAGDPVLRGVAALTSALTLSKTPRARLATHPRSRHPVVLATRCLIPGQKHATRAFDRGVLPTCW